MGLVEGILSNQNILVSLALTIQSVAGSEPVATNHNVIIFVNFDISLHYYSATNLLRKMVISLLEWNKGDSPISMHRIRWI